MAGGVGAGGRVGGAASTPEVRNLASWLQQMSSSLYSEAMPVMSQYISQIQEALTTGGVGAQLPIVQKGVEASRAATSQALRETEELGARLGGGRGSSSLLNALASTALQGQLATAAIPQQAAQWMIGLGSNLIPNALGQALGYAGTAGNIFNNAQQIQAYRDAQATQFYGGLAGGGGSALGGAGAAIGALT